MRNATYYYTYIAVVGNKKRVLKLGTKFRTKLNASNNLRVTQVKSHSTTSNSAEALQ